jgi:hypothetical protein
MRLTVKEHPYESRLARCTLDGVDITTDCFAADEEEGWADCYCRNDEGQHFLRGGMVAWERRHGKVMITFPWPSL